MLGVFFNADDKKKVDLIAPKVMCCIICYNSPILNLNPKIQAKRGLIIIYNIINGITTLKKLDHSNIFYKFEEEMNIPLRKDEKKSSKKRPNMFSSCISKKITIKEPFKMQ
jgi:hypothetical protein